ncbi:succinylglutamate desuccinylase/aspartoacylase family protein [Kiloniella laminariae]|uniref:succinylglutamate desuccinylase/aspartoacylase family protein n=1 Tax=Kiloniella laminariae TaxID=454162 RepID=UPI00036447F5|nr:succinylglutamate desuccinylase/aspartoacylase family protein [Kiloniella laminariae]
MARQTERHPLISETPGTQRNVIFHRYGAGTPGKKTYIQAALHADETPAMAAAHHLLQRLEEADKKGLIKGEIVVVPYANPIGLDQFSSDVLLGRLHTGGEGNFNRSWYDLTEMTRDRLKTRLGKDAEENVSIIRSAMQEAINELVPVSEFDSLRKLLVGEASRADFVFDLHCDDDSLPYLYISSHNWPDCQDFAADFGSYAVMMAENSGGNSFDEVYTRPWAELGRLYPDHPIPQATMSMTVELRGRPDVSDEIGAKDAAALFNFLVRRGLVEGSAPPLPKALCDATGTNACEIITSPGAGFVTYCLELGSIVKKGQQIATLIDPTAEDPTNARTPIYAGTDGIFFTAKQHKAVKPGMVVAKVAGTVALKEGLLLED